MLKNTSVIYKKKTMKISKGIRKNIYQPKTFENPNTCEKKLIITEHPKTAHKFSKTIRQAAKVGCNSALYSDAKKLNIC